MGLDHIMGAGHIHLGCRCTGVSKVVQLGSNGWRCFSGSYHKHLATSQENERLRLIRNSNAHNSLVGFVLSFTICSSLAYSNEIVNSNQAGVALQLASHVTTKANPTLPSEIPDPRTYEKVVTMELDVVDGKYVNRRQYAEEYNRCFGLTYDITKLDSFFRVPLNSLSFPIEEESRECDFDSNTVKWTFKSQIYSLSADLKSAYDYSLRQTHVSSSQIQDLVILVHGLDSNSKSIRKTIEPALVEEGFSVYAYEYPNDGSIIDAAEEFGLLLEKEISSKHPDSRIHIIAHSMGGIVSRVMLEYPDYNSGNVETLIMLATPNKGSYLAEFRPLVELTEAIVWATKDGFGEAGMQLLPNSAFMSWSSLLKRNPQVSYKILLGTKGFFSTDEWGRINESKIRKMVKNGSSEMEIAKTSAQRNKFEELQDNLGDGVVAISRCALDGIQNCEKVNRTHLSILNIEKDKSADPVWRFIIESINGKKKS